MAVYKRTYKSYDGPLTPLALRFLVVQRYAFKTVSRSRLLNTGYMACFIPVIFVICALYLNQNASVLALVRQQPGFLKVNGSFFMNDNFWGFRAFWQDSSPHLSVRHWSRPIWSMGLYRST